ncbi:centrosomal protein CEP57L1 isoform X1 [Megalobrama amblycephala]|uniref:centrosomal protein CEP57L1 isoform X1 n=1 Tax=Megalobrama amblycephala TaxID=75352 RepID=UPI002013E103|nr:centrosomal protein CEP57L1 isoform X1 [Megalobrama amblycephala]
MDHFGDQSLNLDSPSKQSYVGSYYQPPETLSRPLYMNTVTDPRDRKSSGVQDISPQLYQRVPDAGSRAVIAALKTLQEKMRRLELERVQAERNIQQFSHAARHQVDAITKREPENNTQENHSTQRKELVSKVHSAETRCSLLEKQLDYMRKMVECAERERITHTDRQDSLCKESKHTDPQMQAQLNKLERLEKEYLKLTSTQSVAERKIELLEQKLLEEEHERKLVQEKAEKLERELENNLLSLSVATQLNKGKKKKGKASCKKSPSVKVETATTPKAKRLPFVAGTSTSPSHSVNANVQSVLHMMKHRNPRLCERVSALQKSCPQNQRVHRRPSSSPSKASSAMGSLSELLLALQDELGQMSFEHQELVKQIDETTKRELRDDLERELDCLVKRMEEKAAQISKLRKHQQTVQKLSQPSCSPKQKQQKPHWASSVEGKTRAESGVQPLPPSPVKASLSTGQKQIRSSHETLKLLRETQKLCSSLRRQDITWET